MSVPWKSRSKTPQKQDRLILKNIVDPFLNWHSSLFNSCFEEIKKFSDYAKLVEESFSRDGSFEVNEETMYNILSADIQASSKTELSGMFEILPAIPKSIAERLRQSNNNSLFPMNGDGYENDNSFEHSNLLECDSRLMRGKKLISDEFIDTEDMCKELKHLKIMNEFMNNSEEYLQLKKSNKN